MKIKKRTLVMVKKEEISGVIQEIRDGPPLLFIVKTEANKVMRCYYDELTPLIEDCEAESVEDLYKRKDFSITQFQLIKNLTVMIHDLQKQIETLRSTLDGVVLEGLGRTQEHLREHELRPH